MLEAEKRWNGKLRKKNIQAFQDSFADIFDISLGILSLTGKPITVWSNSSMLCHYMKQKNRSRCKKEHVNIRNFVINNRKSKIFTCYMGITGFCIPILNTMGTFAVCYGGGFYLEDMLPLTTKLNEDFPVYSESKLKDIVNLLENTFNLINFDEEVNIALFETNNKSLNFLQRKLTLRELDVVELINEGRTNKEISQKLNITEKTVKTHVSNILKKLQLKDRMQIVLLCKNNNINL